MIDVKLWPRPPPLPSGVAGLALDAPEEHSGWPDANQLDRVEPLRQLPERLGKNARAHGLSTGVLEAEDLSLVQVMEPTNVDTVCLRNVPHNKVSRTLDDGTRRLVVFDQSEDDLASEYELPHVE